MEFHTSWERLKASIEAEQVRQQKIAGTHRSDPLYAGRADAYSAVLGMMNSIEKEKNVAQAKRMGRSDAFLGSDMVLEH